MPVVTDPVSIIEVADLSFRYPRQERDAVSGASFDVRAGEVFGFLGPNGAGKSTLQKVLIRLLASYRGRARVLGRDLSEWGDDFYERVGVSFELPAGYRKLTARENLELFARLYRGDVEPPEVLLEKVGLEDDADQRLSEYSKGMQMRLKLRARAAEPAGAAVPRRADRWSRPGQRGPDQGDHS